MKIINDTLKERGRWSQTKLMVFFSFWACLFHFLYSVITNGTVVDIPSGWLTLILGGSIVKQAATTTERVRGVTYADSDNSGETVGK